MEQQTYLGIEKTTLTDPFPFLDLGTLEKMLSVVLLLKGGVFTRLELEVQHQSMLNNSSRKVKIDGMLSFPWLSSQFGHFPRIFDR